MAVTVHFVVSRLGPITPLLFQVYLFRQIRDTIKSTIAAPVIEINLEKKPFKGYRIPVMEKLPWTYNVNLGSRQKILF